MKLSDDPLWYYKLLWFRGIQLPQCVADEYVCDIIKLRTFICRSMLNQLLRHKAVLSERHFYLQCLRTLFFLQLFL